MNYEIDEEARPDEGWGLVVFAVGTVFGLAGLVVGVVLSVLLR